KDFLEACLKKGRGDFSAAQLFSTLPTIVRALNHFKNVKGRLIFTTSTPFVLFHIKDASAGKKYNHLFFASRYPNNSMHLHFHPIFHYC
ncbi:MAG: hypothetical protein V1860_04015, partial [bacterium]